jgi:hypothetical protein
VWKNTIRNYRRPSWPPTAHAEWPKLAQRAPTGELKLGPIVKDIQAAGVTSWNGIAEALKGRGMPTAAGRRHWCATQMRRVLVRLAG